MVKKTARIHSLSYKIILELEGSFNLTNLPSSYTRGKVEAQPNELKLEVFDSILPCYRSTKRAF